MWKYGKRFLVKTVLIVLGIFIMFQGQGEALASSQFSDISSNYRASTEVNYLADRSIIEGYENGAFKPNEFVKRSEAAAMIGRALKLNGAKTSTSFSDVGASSFASGYIQSAFNANIISGYSDGTFRPNNDVKRGEMAILIAKAFSLKETNTIYFSDVPKESAAFKYVNQIAAAGISEGFPDGKFRGEDYIKRVDFAVFLARALNVNFRIKASTVKTEQIVTVDDLNMRTGPSTSYEIIKKLNTGDRVTVTNYSGSWAKIQFNGLEGYVHVNYIKEPVSYMNNRIITIDAGHGGRDPGAVANGLLEKDINLDTALKLEKRLKSAGVNVVMTRKTDIFIELSERTAIAKRNNSASFISIHANSASAAANGTETFYYSSATSSQVAAESKKLAEFIQKRMISMLGTRDRGVKSGDFYVLRNTSIPSTLVELGFVTNTYDAQKLGSSSWRDKAAEAIYLGILDYYNQQK